MKFILSIFLCILGLITKAQYAHTYNVGTGSGNLTVDGNVTTFLPGSLIVIAPGSYGTINIQNLTSETVENGNGAVIMDGGNGTNNYAGINMTSCNTTHITRNPAIASTVPYGFICQNNNYRPTAISNRNMFDTLEWIEYYNIGDYVIYFSSSTSYVWDGTDATVQGKGLSLKNLLFDSCSATCIEMPGSLSTSAVTNLQRGTEFGYINFRWCDGGDLVFCQPIDQYTIHDCIGWQINNDNDDDNGLFHMVGNGDFYRNYFHEYQGHIIRMWTLSYGAIPEIDSVYDNISDSSYKYSPYEWQSTAGLNIPAAPNTTYVNIRLNNNTHGDLNYSHQTSFDACLVDNYSMPAGATIQAKNNLLFNTFTSNGIAGRMYQFTQTGTDTTKNWYYTSATNAGFNISTLYLTSTSPVINAGIPGFLLYPYDYHGVAFNISSPSIGAVQSYSSSPILAPNSFPRHHKKIIIE